VCLPTSPYIFLHLPISPYISLYLVHQARGRDDLNAITGSLFKPGPYKPLMPKGKGLFDPKAIERTMVQVINPNPNLNPTCVSLHLRYISRVARGSSRARTSSSPTSTTPQERR